MTTTVVVLSFNSSYFESYQPKTDWTNGRTRTIPGVIYWCDAQVEPRQVHLFKKKTAPKTKKGGFKKKADTSKVLFSAHVRSPPQKIDSDSAATILVPGSDYRRILGNLYNGILSSQADISYKTRTFARLKKRG